MKSFDDLSNKQRIILVVLFLILLVYVDVKIAFSKIDDSDIQEEQKITEEVEDKYIHLNRKQAYNKIRKYIEANYLSDEYKFSTNYNDYSDQVYLVFTYNTYKTKEEYENDSRRIYEGLKEYLKSLYIDDIGILSFFRIDVCIYVDKDVTFKLIDDGIINKSPYLRVPYQIGWYRVDLFGDKTYNDDVFKDADNKQFIDWGYYVKK